MKQNFQGLRQKGETIVEVLIAIAVIAAALGGAFAISSKARKTTQADQERYQAQLYANQQADRIKRNSDELPPSGDFCISQSNVVIAPLPDSSCIFGGLYVIKVAPLVTPKTYKIEVTWDSISSSTTDNKDRIELIYGL